MHSLSAEPHKLGESEEESCRNCRMQYAGGKLRTSCNDGHTGDVLDVVHARKLHVGGVICNVHEGGVHLQEEHA